MFPPQAWLAASSGGATVGRPPWGAGRSTGQELADDAAAAGCGKISRPLDESDQKILFSHD
jgi:hypothetical protein